MYGPCVDRGTLSFHQHRSASHIIRRHAVIESIVVVSIHNVGLWLSGQSSLIGS